MVFHFFSLEQDVNMYIQTPPGCRAKHLDVKMTPSQLTIGLKGNPPFINVSDAC